MSGNKLTTRYTILCVYSAYIAIYNTFWCYCISL